MQNLRSAKSFSSLSAGTCASQVKKHYYTQQNPYKILIEKQV